MSLERSMSLEVEDLYQLEDLAMQHAKELADVQILQDLEIKHARQRAELRAKQEAELASRKREKEAKLKSVSPLSRGQKRRRDSVNILVETVRQTTSSTTVKKEDCDDDVVIISSSKKSRHDVEGSSRRRGCPRRSQTHHSRVDKSQHRTYWSASNRVTSRFSWPTTATTRSLSPSRDSPNTFLSPRQSEQPEDMDTGPTHRSPNNTIKSELSHSDVPYLEIGNLQPGSFPQESPTGMRQFYPPYPSRSVPTPPRSPTSLAQNDDNLVSMEQSSSSTKDLPPRMSSPPEHASPPQAAVDAASSPKDPSNVQPLKRISTNTLTTPISGIMAPLQPVPEINLEPSISSSDKSPLRSIPQNVTPSPKVSTAGTPHHPEKVPEKTKSVRKVSAARVQQPPKQTPRKPDSLPKTATPQELPVPSASHVLPPSTIQRAPVAPMITSLNINHSDVLGDAPPPKAIEQPGTKAPMFTIRGAAKGSTASANQTPSDPTTKSAHLLKAHRLDRVIQNLLQSNGHQKRTLSPARKTPSKFYSHNKENLGTAHSARPPPSIEKETFWYHDEGSDCPLHVNYTGSGAWRGSNWKPSVRPESRDKYPSDERRIELFPDMEIHNSNKP
ncbi:hypothetical protein DL98DRAFT_571263 [Cadophora sp. DSE1049]|nr:hypothetical protein DL98DRAFT_571263 [Cadophora sp. DSE1049]